MKCKVLNGYAQIGDIVTVISYGDEKRYLYKVIGFQQYEGTPQIRYRKVIPATLELFPDTVGSWMNFNEALIELKIIHKSKKSFLKRIFGV
ncbi:hypothetical protein HQN89_36275 [Paenibacillus frigoriresistens]|uniref:hypothetical protein n=1 Tax=Paenibacillus alginolyticus TaxID=59839 RepID=UPI00156509B7|nr:hypothetical protein [Paenibacillus frigoriresistens]NRF96228.1 hypothetical protein [Paenibacillus frigoriresistens]